jgi:hypothetical protein
MDKHFKEFLAIGPEAYCQKRHFHCCDLCQKTNCDDNTNPLVARIKELERSIASNSSEIMERIYGK